MAAQATIVSEKQAPGSVQETFFVRSKPELDAMLDLKGYRSTVFKGRICDHDQTDMKPYHAQVARPLGKPVKVEEYAKMVEMGEVTPDGVVRTIGMVVHADTEKFLGYVMIRNEGKPYFRYTGHGPKDVARIQADMLQDTLRALFRGRISHGDLGVEKGLNVYVSDDAVRIADPRLLSFEEGRINDLASMREFYKNIDRREYLKLYAEFLLRSLQNDPVNAFKLACKKIAREFQDNSNRS